MSDGHYKRLAPTRTPPWLAKLPPLLQQKIREHVDARAESAAAVYRRLNLVRYIASRTFREYVQKRRQALKEYRQRAYRAAQVAAQANDEAGVPGGADGDREQTQ